MTAVPVATPVTRPRLLTVATAVVPELHVPPEVRSVSWVVVPVHSVPRPVSGKTTLDRSTMVSPWRFVKTYGSLVLSKTSIGLFALSEKLVFPTAAQLVPSNLFTDVWNGARLSAYATYGVPEPSNAIDIPGATAPVEKAVPTALQLLPLYLLTVALPAFRLSGYATYGVPVASMVSELPFVVAKAAVPTFAHAVPLNVITVRPLPFSKHT